jgi:hypothetical protein
MIRLLASVAVISTLFVTGCATPSYEYTPKVQEISKPPLGTVSTVGVGEQMLEQGRFIERDALQLDREVKTGLLSLYTFTPGHFVRVGGRGAAGFYNASSTQGSGRVEQSAIADPFQVIEYNDETRQFCSVTVFNLKICEKVTDARLTTVFATDENSFQQTLIYSGRVGNKINIGYREFSGNTARPAFNNDVEYDLSESKLIGYRGAELEVIEATNRSITYRVIRNFNAAVQ